MRLTFFTKINLQPRDTKIDVKRNALNSKVEKVGINCTQKFINRIELADTVFISLGPKK